MKKTLSFLFGALLCSTVGYSQTLIPKLGVSMSRATFSDDITKNDSVVVKNKFGFIGGVGLELPISNMFAIQAELLFNQQGWIEKPNDSSNDLKGTITLNYIQIPVMLKVKFGSFYVNAGPSVAFGIGGKYKWVSGSYSHSGKVKFGKAPEKDTSDDLFYVDNTVNVGIQAGAGVVIAKWVMIDVRYGLGLSNIYDKDSDFGIDDNKSKLRSLQLTVGVPIHLGSK